MEGWRIRGKRNRPPRPMRFDTGAGLFCNSPPAMSVLRLPLAFLASAPGAFLRAADGAAAPAPPASGDVLEHFADWVQLRLFPDGGHGALVRGITCALIFLAAVLLRRVVTHIVFRALRKLADRTTTTLDDELFPALEQPVAALIMAGGIFAALTVLQLSPAVDAVVSHGAAVAVLGIIFWGLLRAGAAVLTHVEEIAHARQIGIAHFMPLIKKALAALVIVFGVLMGMKSLGVDVGAVLTGLGIGGLAFAFAAQDTIANLFGSFVVVLDRPFKVGDYVRIGASEGTVEDIGLRSTRLRAADRTLVVMPNRTAAAEPIINFTRMPQRRVMQTISLTYRTAPEQMEAILNDIRAILRDDPAVHQLFTAVFFTDYGASSLDIQIQYFTADPDYRRHLATREAVNLKIMRAVAARGLSFAFPTQTLHVEDDVARKLAGAIPAPQG